MLRCEKDRAWPLQLLPATSSLCRIPGPEPGLEGCGVQPDLGQVQEVAQVPRDKWGLGNTRVPVLGDKKGQRRDWMGGGGGRGQLGPEEPEYSQNWGTLGGTGLRIGRGGLAGTRTGQGRA